MSKILKRIIIILTVFIIVFNIAYPTVCHAVSIGDLFSGDYEVTWGNVGGLLIDGVVGFLTWIPRAILAAVGLVIETILTQLCGIADDGAVLTAEDIIFTGSSRNQQVNILNANFFDLNSSAMNESIVKGFREGIAKWYYALRNLSIVISLAVLLYIGIRMAISSVASEKAMYKKMLTDWLVGFIVLFFLHYLMVIIFNLNDRLVDMLYDIYHNSNEKNLLSDYSTTLFAGVFEPSFVTGWGSLFVYICLLGTTIALFIMYMKRLFTLGFLVVISPLVTVTYSIDKLGDNKSQALDTWMKEFVYNVLIQPFHCIIYMVFVGSAMETLKTTASLSGLVFAILSILFIFKAEDIIKKIFGFEKASSIGGMAAAGALAASGISKLKSGGEKAKSATGKVSGGSGSSGNSGIKRKQASNNNSQRRNNSQSQTNRSSSSSSTNNKKSSALYRAASDMFDGAKNSFNEFKSHPGDSLKSGMKQLALKELAATAKLAPRLYAGGIIAGATGNGFNGIVTGYSMGNGRYTRKLSSIPDNKANELKMDGQAKKLATAYDRYRMANNDMSDEELYNKSADLLEGDISKLTDKNEITLAKQLQGMKEKYEQLGEKDPKKAVMNHIEDIQMGKVRNSVNVSLDKVENAAQNLKLSNPHIPDNDIKGVSREFIADIDEAKRLGEKYLKSDKYKGLGKAEKKLAREIYKSKEVLAAIGESSKGVVNQEIEKAVEKGIEE